VHVRHCAIISGFAYSLAGVVKLVDAGDSKSPGRDTVPVRFRPPAPECLVRPLTRANAAVVGIEVTAVEGARSARTLGPERSGSGVVIGADGLVLTIGYLILEAQTIQLVTQDGRKHDDGQAPGDLSAASPCATVG
jgi:S1-C subfamily serine protease